MSGGETDTIALEKGRLEQKRVADMTELDTSWVEDASLAAISSSSTQDEVSDVWGKALQKRKRNFRILLKLDRRFFDARGKGDIFNQRKYHLLFMKRIEILKYYDDELNRLIKIYSDKSGHPVFVHGENGNSLYWGRGKEMAINDDTIKLLEKTIKSVAEKVRKRHDYKMIK